MNRRTTTRRPRQKGFTLLEAIVALTILGIALVPAVSFISQSAESLMRAADANERSLAMRNAVAALGPVNPMEEPEGELPLGRDLTVTWSSQIAVPPNDGPLFGAGLPGFRVAFYDVRVSLLRGDSAPWFDFDMRKVGYLRLNAGFAPAFGAGP